MRNVTPLTRPPIPKKSRTFLTGPYIRLRLLPGRVLVKERGFDR